MSINRLPNEALFLIVSSLTKLSDVSALARTSQHLHTALNPRLYQLDVDRGLGIALVWAVRTGMQRCFNWAVRARPLDTQPMRGYALDALHHAVVMARLSMVMDLVGRGVPLNERRGGGRTAVHCAVSYKQVAILAWMVDNGGDLGKSWPNDRNQTALHVAASNDGSVELVTFLLRRGFDIDARDGEGKTPLVRAVYHWTSNDPYDEALGMQLDTLNFGCSFNFVAAFSNFWQNIELIRLLLASGADPDARDLYGKTPRGYIQYHPKADIRWLFNELPPPRTEKGGIAEGES